MSIASSWSNYYVEKRKGDEEYFLFFEIKDTGH